LQRDFSGAGRDELFGHVKAPSPVLRSARGPVRTCNGGTIFLDEVSELPLDSQTKLLRVLQEGEFEPVGSSKTVKVDVRVIAATNRDLQKDIAAGRFRADLFYRLTCSHHVPALRDRREDILCWRSISSSAFARKFGKALERIDPESLRRLQEYSGREHSRFARTPSNVPRFSRRHSLQSAGRSRLVNRRRDGIRASGEQWRLARAKSELSPQQRSVESRRDGTSAYPGDLKKTRGVIEGPAGAARLLNLKPSTTRFKIKKLGINDSSSRTDCRARRSGATRPSKSIAAATTPGGRPPRAAGHKPWSGPAPIYRRPQNSMETGIWQ